MGKTRGELWSDSLMAYAVRRAYSSEGTIFLELVNERGMTMAVACLDRAGAKEIADALSLFAQGGGHG